ncbi:MAG: FAD-linked oxidase C-terminal domain-containing protein [Pseudomonadota bacterium]
MLEDMDVVSPNTRTNRASWWPDLHDFLHATLPPECVLSDNDSLTPYQSDGLTAYAQTPPIAALPTSTEQVSAILGYCHKKQIKIVPRGAGTSLSGGALPLADGLLLVTSKLNRILDLDPDNRCARVQACVANLAISEAASPHGLLYAPDPSSQIVCSIGGNVAENAGGVHCLKYGLTTNNLMGLTAVLIDGTVLELGGAHLDNDGLDLIGILTGSEGLLAVITEVTVRLTPIPPEQRAMLIGFDRVEDAAHCVSAIIAEGIIPAGLEMMDQIALRATDAYSKAGYPLEAAAILIAEVDGTGNEIDEVIGKIKTIAQGQNASSLRISENEEQRQRFWAGRKAAFPAMAALAPDYYCVDGSIPRKDIAKVLSKITELGRAANLPVANVFHAGDGNLHPLILYDRSQPGQLEKAEQLGNDILKFCVDVGGALTGEHGVGIEKRGLMEYQFDQTDLAQQQRVKCAFDPNQLLNPGKVFPTLHRCAELGRMHVHHGKIPFSDIPRF